MTTPRPTQMYGSAYLRYKNRMTSGNVMSPDTGFCTSTDDNKKIKTSLTSGNADSYNNTYSQNQYNRHLTDSSSSVNTNNTDNSAPQGSSSGYPERYSYRYSSTSNQKTSTAENTEPKPPVNASSTYPDRYSYKYSYTTPVSQSSTKESSEQIEVPASSTNTNTNYINRYSSNSVYNQPLTNDSKSSPRFSDNPPSDTKITTLDTTSESKENTAPQSILASSGYLGRYRPKRYTSYPAPSSNTENSDTSTVSTSQPVVTSSSYGGYLSRSTYSTSNYGSNTQAADNSNAESRVSTNIHSSVEDSQSTSNSNTGRYTYKYPSRGYMYGTSVITTAQSNNNTTTVTESSNTTEELETEPVVTATTYAYRYPSKSYQHNNNKESADNSKDLQKTTTESQPSVTTTTYSFRSPYSSSRYSSKQNNSSDLKTDAGPDDDADSKVTKSTYSYQYPSKYSSNNTPSSPKNNKPEEVAKEKPLLSYSAKYLSKFSGYNTNVSNNNEVKTEEKVKEEEEEEVVNVEPEVKTSTYSYRYPSKYSSYTKTTSTDKDTREKIVEKESEVKTSYRYPSKYSSSNQTSPNTEAETESEEVFVEEKPDIKTKYTYKYPSRQFSYSSTSDSSKINTTDAREAAKSPTKVEEPNVITQTYTYKYPSLSYKYGIAVTSTESSITATENPTLDSASSSKLDESDPEVTTTTYSYRVPSVSSHNVTPTTTESKTISEQSCEPVVTESTSRYKYRYPSRAYGSGVTSTATPTDSSSVQQYKPTNTSLIPQMTATSDHLSNTESISSEHSTISTMSGSTRMVRQNSQSNNVVLSPALAPRSPGSKHILDNEPKYIFSMGSRTVVEPDVPRSVEKSNSDEIKEVYVPTENVDDQIDDVIEDDEVEVEQDPEDLLTSQELLDMAKQCLEELHLVEAERLYLKCYCKLCYFPEDNHQKMIEVYFGLAEVCTRKSRQSRKSPLEWQWLCVHAAALLGEATELCVHEAKSDDTATAELFNDKLLFAENRNKSLEDLLSRTLYNWLNDDWRAIDPMGANVRNAKARTPITSSNFPLSNMLGLKPYETGFLAQAFSIESLHEMPSSLQGASLDTKSNWFRRIQLYCLKRLNNKNRQEVLDEVMLCHQEDPNKNESQQLGSDDEENGFEEDSSEKKSEHGTDPICSSESIEDENIEDATEEDEDPVPRPEDNTSPLSEKPVKLTIAKIFHRVVIKLIEEQQFSKAELLCEEILQIVEVIQDGTVRLLKFSGELQQNLGILCLKQGDISKGMACLQVALNIFRDLQDGIAHREVSLVLIDMGNAHVALSLSSDQLYQAVIAAIRVFFEKEACDDDDTGETAPEMIRSKEPEPTNPEEEKRKENINEAVKCYREALEVLERNVETDLETIAKALMKLGDCYFMQTEYSKALDSYERAVPMFKNANVFGKDHFLQNGHVMLMLGVATFMLHVYPRAGMIFELAYSMVKHAHQLDINTFLHALLLSLMGIANYKMKQYHKCVSMCYQAFEIFWVMHGEGVVVVPEQRFWLICQNLYILGNSYNVLNLQHKAIKYLNIGRAFMRATENGEKRQFMRILNILGDCYFAQYDYKTALVYYNEALEVGEPAKNEEVVDGEAFSEDEMNQSSEDMALHNQLLSKSAEANISMNQYENAIEYLEQARDMQDVLGEDIKGDLVSTLYQLGQMHSMAGDVDKAISSYKEGLEVFRELHAGNLGPEMCVTLGNLATMCYVKACICEDIDSELQMILAAEGYFQEALKLEMNQSVCVKYANFLYSQGNYDDAIMYLEDALRTTTNLPEIVYGGLEKVTLPEALQDEVDAQEEVEMPSVCLGHFLKVLSYKMLGQTRHSDMCLLELMKSVYDTDIPFLRSVLGYAFMEMGLFEEAAISFASACTMDPEYHLALDNYCLCVCLMSLESLNSAMKTCFIHYRLWYEEQINQVPAICEY